jgi:hypothetical protein
MTKTHPTSTQSPHTVPKYDLTRDEIYETLSNRRRRYALHYLRQRENDVALSDLATQIAAWETDALEETKSGSDSKSSPDARKHVYTALQQFHLPKMEEMGIIAYDRHEATVELTDMGSDLDVYLDVIRGSDVPWSLYYVGLSAISIALVTTISMEIYPIRLLPDIAWIVFFVAVLSISALAHLYDTRNRKFGAEGPPPEVECQ